MPRRSSNTIDNGEWCRETERTGTCDCEDRDESDYSTDPRIDDESVSEHYPSSECQEGETKNDRNKVSCNRISEFLDRGFIVLCFTHE